MQRNGKSGDDQCKEYIDKPTRRDEEEVVDIRKLGETDGK